MVLLAVEARALFIETLTRVLEAAASRKSTVEALLFLLVELWLSLHTRG